MIYKEYVYQKIVLELLISIKMDIDAIKLERCKRCCIGRKCIFCESEVLTETYITFVNIDKTQELGSMYDSILIVGDTHYIRCCGNHEYLMTLLHKIMLTHRYFCMYMVIKLLSLSYRDASKYLNIYEGFNFLRYIVYSYRNDYDNTKPYNEHIVSYMFPVLRNYIKSNPEYKGKENAYICRLSRSYDSLTKSDKKRIIGLYVGIARYSIMYIVKFEHSAMEEIFHMVSLMYGSIRTSRIIEAIIGCE